MLEARKLLERVRERNLAAFIAVWLVATAVALGTLWWTSREVDRASIERDKALVDVVLRQSIARVGHVQESSTFWDEALIQITSDPFDLEWINANVGEWFSEYAGHDEVYMVGADGRPIYAMRDGLQTDVGHYEKVKPAIAPLVAEARRATVPPPSLEMDVAMITPGAADIALIRGRPSIISVKPFASDTEELADHPGTSIVHVSILYLDHKFLNGIEDEYGIRDARISGDPAARAQEESMPIIDRNGKIVSYLVWKPFSPGGVVFSRVWPYLAGGLLLLGCSIVLLALRLDQKSRALEESKRQALHRAMHDALTGLPNRANFEASLPQALRNGLGSGKSTALLYIDIDHFKQVNDQLGHAVGDELLIAVGQRLVKTVRTNDTVYRLGGDEFAVVLREPGSIEQVISICDRIVGDIGSPFIVNGNQCHVGASIGIATAPDHARDEGELAKRADIALYKAKADGRGRYVLFVDELAAAVNERAHFDRDLRCAIDRCDDQLSVVYQPILTAKGEQIRGVEALLRWQHPERGLLTPTAFGHFAEESGLIAALGEWSLRTAAVEAASWPDLKLSVNISPAQIAVTGFADKVLRILKETGLDPARLELELTEVALLNRRGDVPRTIERLREAGVTIALDDFGTGYSSLSHIRDIAVDRVKIDRSFVSASNSPQGLALVQAVVTVAKGHGLEVTAEGVETDWQAQIMRRMGCDHAQGHFWTEPLPAEEFVTFLDSFRGKSSGTSKAARRSR